MLPAVLPSWRLERFADGVGLVPPGGRELGGIRIGDRQRPLKPIAALFREAAASLPIAGLDATPLHAFATAEGEYAASSTLTGTLDGAPIERTLAFVIGDDWYTRIDGVTAIAARFEAMRGLVTELARGYSLGLGAERRRRYLYDPPAGWPGYPRGLTTEWYAPGYPAEHGSIAVFPARPIVESPAGAVDHVLHEIGWTGFVPDANDTVPFTSRFPTGLMRRYRGVRDERVCFQEIAVLADARFAYVCRLETAPESAPAHHAIFEQLLHSIVPLPAPLPSPSSAAASTPFANWAD